VTGNAVTLYYGLIVNGAASTNVLFGPNIIFGGSGSSTFDVAASNSLLYSGVMSGPVGFNKIGTGAMTLNGTGANTFTGVAQVSAGTLFLLQSGVAAPAGLVVGDGTGNYNSDVVVVEATNQFAGPVTVATTGQLVLDNVSHDVTGLTVNGNIVTGTGTLILKGDMTGNGGTITGHLSLGGATRTFNAPTVGAVGIQIAADIVDGGPASGITKTGPGIIRLSGANTYGGQTILEEGRIAVAHAQALGSPAAGTILHGTTALGIEATGATEPVTIATDGTKPAMSCADNGSTSWAGVLWLSSTAKLYVANNCDLHFTNVIGGPGGADLDFISGTIEFDVPNNYQGGTRLKADLPSILKLNAIGAIPATSVVDLGPGTTLNVNGFNQTIAGLSGSGNTMLGTATLTVNQVSDAMTYGGAISGTGSIVKDGFNTWQLDGASTYTGTTTVQAGALIVHGSIVSSVALTGGWVGGSGSTGAIAGTDGKIDLSEAGPPSTLSAKNVTLNSSMALGAYMKGAAGLTSRLNVAGTVTLNNAHLGIAADGAFVAPTDAIVLIDNDGSDPVSGTFENLPEGATITTVNGAFKFRISYVGGTGNDVTLTSLTRAYYLSEGATGPFFDTDILLLNPNNVAAPITIKFLPESGQPITMTDTLAPMSRKTLRVDDLPGLEATAFSTVVNSDDALPLVVERTMQWGNGTVGGAYGAHTDKASPGPSFNWYFAEGAQGFFWTYLLLENPSDFNNEATVEYLRENEPPVQRTYVVPPHARYTVNLFDEPEVKNRAFGMTVNFDRPGMAERSMYFGMDPLFTGGHESAGEVAPSKAWFLPEGATGTFFQTYVLLANPSDAATKATVRFLPDAGGAPITKIYDLAPKRRLTLDIAAQDASLVSANVATEVTADDPIIVERAQYWPYAVWYESHNSFGLTTLAMRWGLAEGRVGGPEASQTYILLANPGTDPAAVTITFLRENGGAPVVKTFNVAAASRFNVRVGPDTEVPELVNERFGAIVQADREIAVERAVYWDANGQVWAAGTSATATRLP
jgi:autotransporter-associated beta strand protein